MTSPLFIWHTESKSITELKDGINLALAQQANSLLILSCSQNDFHAEQINPLLTSLDATVFGGIYPMLIHQDKRLEQGSLVIAFADKFDIHNFNHLNNATNLEEFEQVINQKQCDSIRDKDNFLMFYDSLINDCESFLDSLFEFFDHEITIVGGGAGNLDFVKKPCVFTNQGLVDDIIQLVALPTTLTSGATHGWEIFQGPFLVSTAQDQVVESLDYRPAYHTYQERIESLTAHRFADTDFFTIAKNFPLGIMNINKELIVRDPILTFDNKIQCVGNIPVNTLVYLLAGDPEKLVDSARQAAKIACENPLEKPAIIVFDCISRVLFMEEDFSKELSAIAEQCKNRPLFGVLSLGEIANSQSGTIRLLNKSTVIGSF